MNARACQRCGAKLTEAISRGLCPSCLLWEGLAGTEGQKSEVGGREADVGDQTSEVGGRTASDFGDYELLEEIGRGGMGVVYKARQKSLDRVVALKMLLFGPQAGSEFVQRFQAEAAAAASLQHPNIVAIHEEGLHEGQHYFAMDYVAGLSLAQLAGHQPLPARRAAGYLKTIAEAVHYAHEHGILHRDLKPSNVLIDAQDQPRVTDFGLAKRFEGESQVTLTGQVLGSPSYIPPEQALGRRGKVSRQTDVYALGAMLYHLLTGRPPFQGETMTETLQQLLNTEPPAPRLLNPRVPRDLQTICLKCLEKEIPRRYSTAQELAEELGRFQDGKPIRARPVGAVGRAWKWCRRRPALAGMGLALALTGALGLAGVLWQSHQATKERRLAQKGEYAADMVLAQRALAEHNRGYTLRLLEKHHPARKSEVDLRGWEWRYLWRLCQGDELFTLHRYPHAIEALALSPDGSLLAVGTKDLVALWDLNRKRALTVLSNTAIPPLAFTSTGLLATGTRGATGELGLALWDVKTRRILKSLPCRPGVSLVGLSPDRKLPLSPDGKLVAIWEKRGVVQIVDFTSGRILTNIPFSQRRSAGSIAAFTPDGTRLAIGEDYGRMRLFDLRTGSAAVLLPTQRGVEVSRLAFSPNGDLLAVGYSHHKENKCTVCLWDLRTLESRGELAIPASDLNGLAFAPDGGHLISTAMDWSIRIWDVTNRAEERCLWSRYGAEAVMLPDRKTLVSGEEDGSICFWDAFAGPRPPAHTNLVVSPSIGSFAEVDAPELRSDNLDPRAVCRLGVAFTPNSDRFITTDTNGSLLLGDAQSLRLLEALPAFGSNHWGMALSPDGRWLATGDAEEKLTVWNYTNRTAVTRFALPFDYYGFLRFSRSGQYLVASVRCSDWTTSARLWRTNDWVEVPLTGGRFVGLWPVDLSPDDRLLAAGYISGAVKLFRFRFPSLQDEATLPEHPGIVSGVLFSPNGRELLSVGRYGSIRLWDVRARREKAEWRGDMTMIWGSVLSPDGSRLATGGLSTRGDAIQLWDLAARRETLSLHGEKLDFVHLTFSPDGNTLAATGLSGIAHLWRAPSWKEIEAIELAKSTPRQP